MLEFMDSVNGFKLHNGIGRKEQRWCSLWKLGLGLK